MTQRLRATTFALLVYLAFFASGAASLIAEVTWNRMLIVVVGNSLSATALIVIVFMGGLGLGSWIGARTFAKRPPSLWPYLAMELIVGAYVLLSPAIFSALAGFFTSLADRIDNQAGLTLARVVVSLAALLAPAVLMGATFPAMIRGAARGAGQRRSARPAYLYSLNTIGAALGTFVGGYHLLLEFGVQFTLNAACGLYAVAATCAVLAQAAAADRSRAASAEQLPSPAAPAPAPADPRRRFLLVATFAVGFVSLAYEVLLTRLGILHLGNSVSVFPLVLTGFLLGTGVSAVAGTWLHDRLRRRPSAADRLFGSLALAAGFAILGAPYLLLTDWLLGTEQAARIAYSAPLNPLPILGIIIAPTLFIGALLPLAIRMLAPDGQEETAREAATLYALNTAGGLAGAGLANHYLVPAIGMQATLCLLAFVCLAAGFGGLLTRGRGWRRWAAPIAAAATLGLVLFATLPDMIDMYARRIARSTRAARAEVKLVVEGRAATVTVIDQDDPERGTYRDMYLNGVEEASTRYWHAQLFKLLGVFPVLVHASDAPKDALVIAFGAGITAGSVLASDTVASLDVVDLNPDVEGINGLFTDVNGDVYHQPRFHFHADDGRNFLVTTHKQYDVIVNDSTHPRAYDSWILYTEEFYAAVKKRLAPGGVFAQWVPVLGSMKGDLMKIHLNTFRRAFPNATCWYVYGSDQAFLLATPEPFTLDARQLQARLDRLPAWFRAGEYQLDTVAHLAGFFWLDGPAMARMIGPETRVNRDGVHYFDKQSAVWPAPPALQLPMFQASILPYLHGDDDALRIAVKQEQNVAGLLGRFAFYESRPDLHRAYCADPGNGNARYWLSLDNAGVLPAPDAFCREESVRTYRALVAQHPENPILLNALADVLCEAGELEEALTLSQRAASLAPDNGMVFDTLGLILFRQGKVAEALAALVHADERLTNHPIVMFHLGAAHLAAGHRGPAREYLTRALQVPGGFPDAANARSLLAQLN
jgi:spermidine synthase